MGPPRRSAMSIVRSLGASGSVVEAELLDRTAAVVDEAPGHPEIWILAGGQDVGRRLRRGGGVLHPPRRGASPPLVRQPREPGESVADLSPGDSLAGLRSDPEALEPFDQVG